MSKSGAIARLRGCATEFGKVEQGSDERIGASHDLTAPQLPTTCAAREAFLTGLVYDTCAMGIQ